MNRIKVETSDPNKFIKKYQGAGLILVDFRDVVEQQYNEQIYNNLGTCFKATAVGHTHVTRRDYALIDVHNEDVFNNLLLEEILSFIKNLNYENFYHVLRDERVGILYNYSTIPRDNLASLLSTRRYIHSLYEDKRMLRFHTVECMSKYLVTVIQEGDK